LSDAALQWIIDLVSLLKPGGSTVISRVSFTPWGSTVYDLLENVLGGTAADRVLENIVGSSYTHRYVLEDSTVRYFRLHTALPDGVWGYVSPDKRHHFTVRADGLYQRRDCVITESGEQLILCALHGHFWIEKMTGFLAEAPPVTSPDFSIPESAVQLRRRVGCQRCSAWRDA
jgi:hypothetical protein